jgi:hypothetical protein
MKRQLRDWIEGEVGLILEGFEDCDGVKEWARLDKALSRFRAGKDSRRDRNLLRFQIECKLESDSYFDDLGEQVQAEKAVEALGARKGRV